MATRLRAEALQRASAQAGRHVARAHVLHVGSAGQQRARSPGRCKQYCGLAGRTFLNILSS